VTKQDRRRVEPHEINRILQLANTTWRRTKRQLPNQDVKALEATDFAERLTKLEQMTNR
jgi:hypothetical protein